MQAPVRYSPDVEDVKPDKAKTIEGLNETLDPILETVTNDSGYPVRSVHVNSHGTLRAR